MNKFLLIALFFSVTGMAAANETGEIFRCDGAKGERLLNFCRVQAKINCSDDANFDECVKKLTAECYRVCSYEKPEDQQ